MAKAVKLILAAMRTSEFWAIGAQALIEAQHLPVPQEFQNIGWAYIVLRVLSKLVQYILPNPNNPNGGFFKAD